MPLNVGARHGHYDVTAKLGEGGMGEVWEATDTKLNRQVALKILPEAFAADPDRLARFQREAQVLASLNHPGIAQIYGIEEADDTRALVLELVEGPTLADRIAQGPIPVDEALPIAKQIAEALDAAHEQGIIHRDLKPANIKLKPDGTVKVLDFGLAKAFQPNASDVSTSMSPTISLTAAATEIGMVIGTAAYMAPEQASGKLVDKRVDVWAFGVVLYEMLTGTRPFIGDDVTKTLARVIDRDPDWSALPAVLPPLLRRFLRGCLQKDPKQRVRDIGDVRLALAGTFDAELTPAVAGQAGLPVRLVAVLAAGAAVVAALFTGGLAWWLRAPPVVASGGVNRFAVNLPGSVALRGRTLVPVVISRDGRRLLFNGASTAGEQLYLRALDDLAAVPIRGASGSVGSLFLSPDGEWVAFNDTTDNTFKRVRVGGGPAVTITDTGMVGGGFRGASWGERGTIVFATRGSPALMQVPEGGGEASPLTAPGEGEEHYYPQFLPGSHALLFTARQPGQPDRVAALDIESGEVHALVDGSNPRFVASGHLLFLRENVVWAAPFDADRVALTSEAVPVLEQVSNLDGFAQMSVSDDGTLVYVTGGIRTMSLVWVDRGGREEPIPGIPPDIYNAVEVSPDGTRLALAGMSNEDVWIYDLRRQTFTPLTTDPAEDRFPLWTLDGERILFESNPGEERALFMVPSDGSAAAERWFTPDSAAAIVYPTSWSPDGTTLLMSTLLAGSSSVDIVARHEDGRTEPLLVTPMNEGGAAISPDGRWVAYISDVSGRFEVYVQRYPELGGRQQISVGGGGFPRWSADGATLFYMSESGSELFAVALGDAAADPWGAPEPLFEGDYRGLSPARTYDVAPDGRFVMIKPGLTGDADRDEMSELVIVLNWHTELLERVPVP